MGLGGLNVFGSLTINGKKLTFEDFDTNKDGKISVEEFDSLLKSEKCDTLELSTMDTDGDKIITEEEFADFEQKTQIQEALNELQATIAKDFTGTNAQYASQCMAELRDFATEFVANYSGTGDMVADFKAALPAKYEEIKNNILDNTPEALAKKAENEKKEIKSRVIDNYVNEYIANAQNAKTEIPAELAKSIANALGKKLETFANEFIKTYTGDNLETDLKAYLDKVMNQSPIEKMADAISNYREAYGDLGAYIDENDLETLKENVREFLTQALNNGIIFKLNGRTLSSDAQIDAVLKTFTNGEVLNNAIESLINSISTESPKETIINQKTKEYEIAAEKKFADTKGAEYAIDPTAIDYSEIDGYDNGGQIYERGKGWSGSKDKAYDKGVELLNNESLKSQMKAQIKSMLEAKGIPFEKVETIFENVYNQSITDTLNTDGMITGRGARGLSKKGKAYINIKDLVDSFITTFNKNIEKTINEMNASNTDMDIKDINVTELATDEDGNINENLVNLINYGGKISLVSRTVAENILEKLQTTMRAKAKAMCTANGVEFDESVFKTQFNNAKSLAAGNQFNVNEKGSVGLINSSLESLTNGAYGNMNPQEMVTEFLTTFKKNYTTWVENQKTKNK